MWTNYIIFKKFEIFEYCFSKKKIFVKENNEYYSFFRLLYFKMWNVQINIVSPHYNVDLAMVLQYIRFQVTITRNYEDFNF
jgi:hypothetical protein